jgi:hypothetical protein
MSYFPEGIFYMEGGIDSGFRHVEPTSYDTKLYIIKGKRYPRVWQVEMSGSSLNEGDAFILDAGMKLYFWVGVDANVNEKIKAMSVLFNIKNTERGGKPEHYYPREQPEIEEEFWTLLGGKPDSIKPAVPDDIVDTGDAQF